MILALLFKIVIVIVIVLVHAKKKR